MRLKISRYHSDSLKWTVVRVWIYIEKWREDPGRLESVQTIVDPSCGGTPIASLSESENIGEGGRSVVCASPQCQVNMAARLIWCEPVDEPSRHGSPWIKL
jgi:hypothetical protein